MSDLDSLESVKRRLEGIRSEHSARMELVARKFEESNKATAESHEKFVEKEKRLVERLREMAKAQREQAANRNKPKEYAFGPEDDEPVVDELAQELAALERTRAAHAAPQSPEGSFLQAPTTQPTPWGRTPSGPPVPPPPPVQPARPPAAPPRRRPQPVDDDDDFGGQSWLT
ncbi:hypothetical protein [Saccharothrix syringae]|uniref:Uncharacterized protein n=1 Tax=Saccharothrix syringae TaxID=103733 RepID=A0A5Q0HCQ4_SACSY|nr:hypothetical protein [Saccharothrix syringae]QFZ23432.1 hypothetical protein EKG83_43690 [Saccharothrix syringae]